MKRLTWDEKYNILTEYIKEHNGKYPNSKEFYREIALGRWVEAQRVIYNKGERLEGGTLKYKTSILTKEQIEKLNEIGFIWNIWDCKYNLLVEYLTEHDGRYPKRNEIYKGEAIGLWITHQRIIYNKGERLEGEALKYKTSILTKEQVEKLININFLWKSNTYEANWEINYNLLIEYLKEYNGRYPTQKEIYKEVNLGRWVEAQRVIYNKGERLEGGTLKYKTSILKKEQIEKLNEINFLWNSNIDDYKWDEKYELFKEYLKEYNGKYPTSTEIYKEIKLGQWVVKQRAIYSNGEKQEDGSMVYNGHKLTKEQIEKLNEIGFVWMIYFKKDYNVNIKDENVRRIINKKILYKLKRVLCESKNEIESKEDIKQIEEDFVKQLTIFD